MAVLPFLSTLLWWHANGNLSNEEHFQRFGLYFLVFLIIIYIMVLYINRLLNDNQKMSFLYFLKSKLDVKGGG